MLEINHVFMPLFWSTVGVAIIWCVLNLIIRNRFKSSAITTLITILFFSYGPFIVALNNAPENVIGISSDLYLSINCLLILGLVGYILIKYPTNYWALNRYLNLIGVMLLLFPIYTILINYMQYSNEVIKKAKKPFNGLDKIENSEVFEKPNIYYIILDGYGREDVLNSVYEYDNAMFYKELEKRGFYIARNSRSNYSQTLLSLASSLNMQYIDSVLDVDLIQKPVFRKYLVELIDKNTVSKILKDLGYKFITFSSGYTGTEITNSDVNYSPSISLNEFEISLINTTPISYIYRKMKKISPFFLHKERITYTLETIPEVKFQDDPFFLFAHIIAPHPPFVLNSENDSLDISQRYLFNLDDGDHYHSYNFILQNFYKRQYISQLKELNRLVIKMLDDVLSRSMKRPIIILQSDHGPGALLSWEFPNPNIYEERLSILNAYNFPINADSELYQSITPVNSFRIIFNNYFNFGFDLLVDRSYFSKWSSPYEFIEVDSILNTLSP